MVTQDFSPRYLTLKLRVSHRPSAERLLNDIQMWVVRRNPLLRTGQQSVCWKQCLSLLSLPVSPPRRARIAPLRGLSRGGPSLPGFNSCTECTVSPFALFRRPLSRTLKSVSKIYTCHAARHEDPTGRNHDLFNIPHRTRICLSYALEEGYGVKRRARLDAARRQAEPWFYDHMPQSPGNG